MHSSYALQPDDFAVERDGAAEPLSDALAGRLAARRPPRRRARPADGRRRLLEPDLRHEHALLRRPARDQGHRRLLPLRRHVPVRRRLRARRLQPARRVAAAQVRGRAAAAPPRRCIEADQRSPHHAAGGARDGRALPRRGRALDLERVPRTGALRRAPTRRARAARAAPTSRWSATRSSRATSSRRSSRRPASAPASRRACAACAATSTARRSVGRGVPHARRARPRRARLLGVTEVLPPGHQELTRRATPTMIMPRRGADAAARRALAAPLDAGARPRPSRSRTPAPAERRRTERSSTPPSTRSQRRMGGHVRRVGGLGLDLRLRRSRSPSTTRCARRSGSGTSRRFGSGSSRGPTRCAAADCCFTSDMAALEVGQCATAPFCDERGQDARRRHRLPRARPRTASSS